MGDMPELQAILTLEGDQLRVDLLTDPPQTAFFEIMHVRMMLEGRTNMAYSPKMRILKQPWQESVTIEGKEGRVVLTAAVIRMLLNETNSIISQSPHEAPQRDRPRRPGTTRSGR